jgi:hypothetical protein
MGIDRHTDSGSHHVLAKTSDANDLSAAFGKSAVLRLTRRQ